MSAWIVEKAHIDALLWAAKSERWGLTYECHGETHRIRPDTTDEEMSRLGEELARVNKASVFYRYQHMSDSELASMVPRAMRQAYEYAEPKRKPSPVETLKNIHCYQYQACENEELWETSEPKAFTDQLMHAMAGKAPGYDAAPWGWSDDA